MIKAIWSKIKESSLSVIPITIIVILLNFIVPLPASTMVDFLVGAVSLILGMALFTLGADSSMILMGDKIGEHMMKRKKVWLLVVLGIFIGIIITIAEPDLTVLAEQFTTIPKYALILTVAVGFGLFLAVALLRIVFQINLSLLLVISYGVAFLLAFLVNPDFVPVAFDSGGVTTGPITVPFILSLGMGVAAARGDQASKDDSFGLVALCSIGPIISVLILGLIFPSNVQDVATNNTIWTYFKEVAIALLPIIAFFVVYQLLFLKISKKRFLKVIIGLVFTYLGLVLFLAGANLGFSPVAKHLGMALADKSYNWILLPIGLIIGFFTVMAEPAVHVLNHQVEEITSGAISRKVMLFSMSIGVAIALFLSMMRILFDISIWWVIIPGYAIAIILTFIVPKIFTAIAFDSGGVASGPLTAAFILPLAMGACEQISPDKILNNAFGVVACVAMTPLIVIQIVGIIYQVKIKRYNERNIVSEALLDIDEVITFKETPDMAYVLMENIRKRLYEASHTMGNNEDDNSDDENAISDNNENNQGGTTNE